MKKKKSEPKPEPTSITVEGFAGSSVPHPTTSYGGPPLGNAPRVGNFSVNNVLIALLVALYNDPDSNHHHRLALSKEAQRFGVDDLRALARAAREGVA